MNEMFVVKKTYLGGPQSPQGEAFTRQEIEGGSSPRGPWDQNPRTIFSREGGSISDHQ